MTPKEKALQLVDKYLGTIIFNIQESIDATVLPAAKQCALICVDELMEFTIHKKSDLYYKFEIYWKEVKQEINKLQL